MPAVLVAAAIAGGCAQPGGTGTEAPSTGHDVIGRKPVKYAGEIPCADCPGQADLLETYWRPVEIETRPVVIRPGTREPHFVLSAEGNRVRGFTGCNNLAGGFAQGVDGFRFNGLVTTRMACLPESDLEAHFLSALNATTSQRVAGETLELRDRDGKLRMRLEARYLK
jgi:heat shock protein HslJ